MIGRVFFFLVAEALLSWPTASRANTTCHSHHFYVERNMLIEKLSKEKSIKTKMQIVTQWFHLFGNIRAHVFLKSFRRIKWNNSVRQTSIFNHWYHFMSRHDGCPLSSSHPGTRLYCRVVLIAPVVMPSFAHGDSQSERGTRFSVFYWWPRPHDLIANCNGSL